MLCSMITEPQVNVRMLGASVLVPVPTNVCLMLNGNNLSLVRDLRRRVLLVRLNAGVERPEERVFSREAVGYVRERRGSLIHDVLTITRAYSVHGEPHVGMLPFGGFSGTKPSAVHCSGSVCLIRSYRLKDCESSTLTSRRPGPFSGVVGAIQARRRDLRRSRRDGAKACATVRWRDRTRAP